MFQNMIGIIHPVRDDFDFSLERINLEVEDKTVHPIEGEAIEFGGSKQTDRRSRQPALS